MENHRQYTSAEIADLIHKAGVRPSAQRIAVLEYIANERQHPTVDEIFTVLSVHFPSLSRTTVYNTVHILVEARIVRELEIEPGTMHYDLAPQPEHSHFICRRCGRIFDMPMPPTPEPQASGFAIDQVEVYYKGLCPQCNENQ